jgi:hypothetical protein
MTSSVIEASSVLFCAFMTRVSQCPISLSSEHPIIQHPVAVINDLIRRGQS